MDPRIASEVSPLDEQRHRGLPVDEMQEWCLEHPAVSLEKVRVPRKDTMKDERHTKKVKWRTIKADTRYYNANS